uniref:MBOAT-domain-containing protein n=1 Tax=Rhabditophanes sp. KR3021 TaxID=114890 RepID=A0AC35UFA3_9BILA
MEPNRIFNDGSTLLTPIGKLFGVQCEKINFVVYQIFCFIFSSYFYNHMDIGKVSLKARTVFPIVVGCCLCYFQYGIAIQHLIYIVFTNYAIMLFSPIEYVHKLCFVFPMAYLMIIHWYRYMYIENTSIDITGPIMILVQKCSMLGFNLHDGVARKEEDLKEYQKKESIKEVPSLDIYLSYMFFFNTLLSGPYFAFTDYKNFIEQTHYKPSFANPQGRLNAISGKSYQSGILLALYVVTLKYHPSVLLTSAYLALPWYQWILYWEIHTLPVKLIYEYAWSVCDLTCNIAGFGFNGYDKDDNEKWDLVTNVYPIKVEFPTNFKEGMDSWNISTLKWLRRVAFDRAPVSMRTISTYALSSVWHGYQIGYYLTFFSAALFTQAARIGRRCLRWRFVDNPTQKLGYDIFTVIITRLALTYGGAPFALMKLRPSLEIWSQVYFYCHILSIAIIFLLPMYFKPQKKAEDEKPKEMHLDETSSTASFIALVDEKRKIE